MGLSKAIEQQLAEIADKTRQLIQMQKELETIHATGKDQLTALQDEKTQLLSEREHLQAQLKSVEERLVVVDLGIDKAEREKYLRLQEWQHKSVNQGLIANH